MASVQCPQANDALSSCRSLRRTSHGLTQPVDPPDHAGITEKLPVGFGVRQAVVHVVASTTNRSA